MQPTVKQGDASARIYISMNKILAEFTELLPWAYRLRLGFIHIFFEVIQHLAVIAIFTPKRAFVSRFKHSIVAGSAMCTCTTTRSVVSSPDGMFYHCQLHQISTPGDVLSLFLRIALYLV